MSESDPLFYVVVACGIIGMLYLLFTPPPDPSYFNKYVPKSPKVQRLSQRPQGPPPEDLEDDAVYYEHHRLNYQRLRRQIDLERRRVFELEQIANVNKKIIHNIAKHNEEIPLPENSNKYHITEEDDCPICFGEINLEIVPCGHGICKDCFAIYNNVCCLCKELVATAVPFKKHPLEI